jgi:hypothetical protein
MQNPTCLTTHTTHTSRRPTRPTITPEAPHVEVITTSAEALDYLMEYAAINRLLTTLRGATDAESLRDCEVYRARRYALEAILLFNLVNH